MIFSVEQENEFARWREDDGDHILNLDYSLCEDSVVFDVGGYKGSFTEKINKKYGCKIFCFEPIPVYYKALVDKFKDDENITVLPYVIYDYNGKGFIYMAKDSSGLFNQNRDKYTVQYRTMDSVMNELNITFIDLLKLNVEGSEYSIIKHIIENDFIKKVDNIRVQFHVFVEDYMKKYNYLQEQLSKTHFLTFRYSFVWENWKKI